MSPEERLANPHPDWQVLHDFLIQQRSLHLAVVRARSDKATVSRRDPEDVLQQAYLKAHQAWDRYLVSEIPLSAWFACILRDCLRDDYKYQCAQKRAGAAQVDLPEHFETANANVLQSPVTDPVEKLRRNELEAKVRRVLDQLTTDHREIINLIDYCELTCVKAAQLLGITNEAARQRHVRARIQFRKTWKELYGDESISL